MVPTQSLIVPWVNIQILIEKVGNFSKHAQIAIQTNKSKCENTKWKIIVYKIEFNSVFSYVKEGSKMGH